MSLGEPTSEHFFVVTGASSGIGREMTRAAAARGHPVAIVARRRDRLERLADELDAAYGVPVEIHVCDLFDRAQREDLLRSIAAGDRALSGLCNCAGTGAFGRFDTLPIERERNQVSLHVEALIELVHGVLPGMIERRSGAVLNVGSIAAMQPIPHNATYAATKSFVGSFSEALHAELAGSGVSCTLLSPGPVRTEFAAAAGLASLGQAGPRLLWSDPAKVARAGLEAMEEGRRVSVPGLLARVAAVLGRFTPRPLSLRVLSVGSSRLLGLEAREPSLRGRAIGSTGRGGEGELR